MSSYRPSPGVNAPDAGALVQPILVIGSHRAGTTLVARLLERLGVFLGAKKERNHEALFFLALNDWLLAEAGGKWDHPLPTRELMDDAAALQILADYSRARLRSVGALRFLGVRRWARARDVMELQEPWGFKDPRTTFTLPLWRRLFPGARVVHVTRHGVDVAASLRDRRGKHLAAARQRVASESFFLHPRPLRHGLLDSPRCATLEGAFALWEEYEEEARARAAGDGALRFVFERLCSEPAAAIDELARFAGVDPPRQQRDAAVASVNQSRAFAFKEDRELAAFAAANAGRLARFGY